VVVCLERGADLHTAQLMPLPLTVSCFSEIQIGFTILVPAHPGSPGQRAVKWACVCVSVTELLDSAVCNLLVLTAKSTVFLQKLFLAASQEKVADTASDQQKTD